MFFNESQEPTLNIPASETGLSGDLAGVYRMVSESTEDWFNLREKMMKVEHVSIVSEDTALLQEGATEFFGKIGNFFKRMLAKIKEIWSKFVAFINQQVLTDKSFVAKYEKVLREKKSFAGFEVSMIKWKTDDLGSHLNFQNALTMASGLMKDVVSNESDEKLRERLNGEAFNKDINKAIMGEAVEGGEFSKAIKKLFVEGGDLERKEVKFAQLNYSTMFELIKSADKNIKAAQKEEKIIEKMLEELAKFFDGISKKISGGETHANSSAIVKQDGHRGSETTDGGSTYNTGVASGNLKYTNDHTGRSEGRFQMRDKASLAAGGCRKISSVASTAFGVLIQSIRERRNEYRSVIAKLATHNPAKSESFSFGYESAESILDRF